MSKPVMVQLNARANAALDWSAESEQALALIAKGKKILWNLDLGLFQHLQKPLSNAAQFMTLAFAIDHFRNEIWPKFHRFSKGVSLYTGNGDYLPGFKWDEEQTQNFELWMNEHGLIQQERQELLLQLYARDVSAEYIEQIASRLPDEIPAFIVFEQLPESSLLQALLTDPERYGRVQIINHASTFTWNREKELPLGICMPGLDCVDPILLAPFGQLMLKLSNRGEPYKLIPEAHLTTAWHGLNTLIYSPEAISASGKRKLQGFTAAGGELISIHTHDSHFI